MKKTPPPEFPLRFVAALKQAMQWAERMEEGIEFRLGELKPPFFTDGHLDTDDGFRLIAEKDFAKGDAISLLPLTLLPDDLEQVTLIDKLGISRTVAANRFYLCFDGYLGFDYDLLGVQHRCFNRRNCCTEVKLLNESVLALYTYATKNIAAGEPLFSDYNLYQAEIEAEEGIECPECDLQGCMGVTLGFQGYDQQTRIKLLQTKSIDLFCAADYYYGVKDTPLLKRELDLHYIPHLTTEALFLFRYTLSL